jgi:aryl-alcohol dehydrogenase-like predicted oxidoreductase
MKRKLGRSDIEVSAIGMGCWAIGGPWTIHGNQAGWGEVDDNESIRAIHCALDLGVNFFDTAANYGCGHSEQILGRALVGRRDQVVLATKFGYMVDEETKRVEFYDDDLNSDKVVTNLRQDCEASLRRLNTDYIDLYQFHINKYTLSKAPAVRDALEKLVSEGKVRCYGWSTDNPEGARVFAEGEHCVAIQHRLNVAMDAPDMLAVCDEFGLASINRGPLARGVLTGKYTADSKFAQNDLRDGDSFRSGWIIPTLEKLGAIRDILTSNGRTLPQGALAWIWGRNEKTIPIPGIRTSAQARENVAAMQFGPLSQEQMVEIERLIGR